NSFDLALRRTDSDADHLLATYRAGPRYLLRADIEGKAGGILTRIVGAPGKALRATASGAGNHPKGEEQFPATLGDDELASGQVQWLPTRWQAATHARFDLLPSFGEVARRVGLTLALRANGARVGAFSAHAETPFIILTMTGALDERHGVTGPA